MASVQLLVVVGPANRHVSTSPGGMKKAEDHVDILAFSPTFLLRNVKDLHLHVSSAGIQACGVRNEPANWLRFLPVVHQPG